MFSSWPHLFLNLRPPRQWQRSIYDGEAISFRQLLQQKSSWPDRETIGAGGSTNESAGGVEITVDRKFLTRPMYTPISAGG